MFGIVEEREELGEETGAAFGRELVVEPPEPGAEESPEGVDVGPGGEPGFVSFAV